MSDQITELLSFIEQSPTAFQAVENMCRQLLAAGYTELEESQSWKLEEGGRFFVVRNQSALIAFRLPTRNYSGFQIVASHGDSPSFKIKESPEMRVENQYVKLNVEKYGGMLCAPWFDRPLSVAGRLIVETPNGLESRLVRIDRDLLLIPSLAIHMNRDVNDGYAYNVQKDLLPLWGDGSAEKGSFLSMVAREAGVEADSIRGSDLFLYNRMHGCVWGDGGRFLSAPRLDDIECAYGSLQGFLCGSTAASVPVFCMLDNEEVGSGTKQGAASTFLRDTLHRINGSAGRSEEEYLTSIACSFMVSADNAHAMHPNYADKCDPTNRPHLNGGVVIKHSANQKYTTDAVSDALFRCICDRAGTTPQHFHNRSDMLGGSTLGNLSGNQVAVNTVDIGLPQLAMHSPYETAGVQDYSDFIRICEKFYSVSVAVKDRRLMIQE